MQINPFRGIDLAEQKAPRFYSLNIFFNFS